MSLSPGIFISVHVRSHKALETYPRVLFASFMHSSQDLNKQSTKIVLRFRHNSLASWKQTLKLFVCHCQAYTRRCTAVGARAREPSCDQKLESVSFAILYRSSTVTPIVHRREAAVFYYSHGRQVSWILQIWS